MPTPKWNNLGSIPTAWVLLPDVIRRAWCSLPFNFWWLYICAVNFSPPPKFHLINPDISNYCVVIEPNICMFFFILSSLSLLLLTFLIYPPSFCVPIASSGRCTNWFCRYILVSMESANELGALYSPLPMAIIYSYCPFLMCFLTARLFCFRGV